MKVLIFGGKGYIGSELLRIFPGAVAPDVDIADPVAVREALEEVQPDAVINAAGKTGRPNVDWCEDHKIETLRSNVTGPLVLLDECQKKGIYFVHIGSGCIYDGTGGADGFTEEDTPNFTGSFYSLTKATSDQLLKPFPVLQLRLRMPFDRTPGPRNLLSKLIKYNKVLDAGNSITYMPDFFMALQKLMEKKVTGTFNMVNPGAISPYEVMRRYTEIVDPSHQCERITVDELDTVVKAPRSNCILSCKKLQALGIELKSVDEAIDEALQAFKANKEGV